MSSSSNNAISIGSYLVHQLTNIAYSNVNICYNTLSSTGTTLNQPSDIDPVINQALNLNATDALAIGNFLIICSQTSVPTIYPFTPIASQFQQQTAYNLCTKSLTEMFKCISVVANTFAQNDVFLGLQAFLPSLVPAVIVALIESIMTTSSLPMQFTPFSDAINQAVSATTNLYASRAIDQNTNQSIMNDLLNCQSVLWNYIIISNNTTLNSNLTEQKLNTFIITTLSTLSSNSSLINLINQLLSITNPTTQPTPILTQIFQNIT